MLGSTGTWQRSLSGRGVALTRVVIAAAVVAALVFLCFRIFRSAEERCEEAIEECRAALAGGRDAEFLAFFDPTVRYQSKGDLAAVRRDLAIFRSAGSPAVGFTRKEISISDEDDTVAADVDLDVVLSAGMRPLAAAKVRVRAVERDEGWRIVALTWE